MKLEDYRDAWDGQVVVSDVRRIVGADRRRKKATEVFLVATIVLGAIALAHTAWYQFEVRDAGWLMTLMRCTPLAVCVPIQVFALRKLRRQVAQRQSCAMPPADCLKTIEEDLIRDSRVLSPARILPLMLLASAFIGLTKWVDYRQGHDTPAECVAITLFSTALFLGMGAFIWHYQRQFVEPRRQHVRTVLGNLEHPAG